MLALILAAWVASAVEIERVLAVVDRTPILASDVELATIAQLVPRDEGESDESLRSATLEALIALELRWQDLEAAAIAARTTVDVDASWARVAQRAGGEDVLRERLLAAGFSEAVLRALLRRAAVVQSYVTSHFAPFVRPTVEEITAVYERELVPALRAAGDEVPSLDAMRADIEALVRERKLLAELERWTAELEGRVQVVRYSR
ncbi:MAG: hypothetical protein ACOY3Y_19400 [Acidobacteriota bacterium]